MSQRHQPEYITTSDYQPHFYPTGQHNDRAVRCNNCRVQLAKGQGRQWDYSDFAYGYVRTAHPKYYCPACHADRKAMFDIEPELYALTSNITAWCKAYINLSMGGHAGDHIQRMVYACGLRGLEIARRVWDGLPQLEECSYESVLGLARRVARSVMTQESEDPA
jgi:hypothetical protein